MNASTICPNCHTENPADAARCQSCGARLFNENATVPDMPALHIDSDGERTQVEHAAGPGLMLVSGYYTDVGRARKLNQDSLLVLEMNKVNISRPSPLGLYAVADGMGGHAAGEVASGIVVSTLARHAQSSLVSAALDGALDDDRIQQWIKSAVAAANAAVIEKRATVHSDMGSTLVMALVKDSTAHITHVGDSRAYRLTADGELERLTLDHSLVEQLVLSKRITPEQAHTHPQRNVIYRTMGDKEDMEADMRSVELNAGDRLILCCDGLNGMILDEQIAAITCAAASPAEAARRLVEAANEAGGQDNITAIVVEAAAL